MNGCAVDGASEMKGVIKLLELVRDREFARERFCVCVCVRERGGERVCARES